MDEFEQDVMERDMGKTTAQKIAEQFENDGQCWTNKAGENLEVACNDVCYALDHRNGEVRWTFRDGSVITTSNGAWNYGYEACWCWVPDGGDAPHEKCIS